METVSVKVTKFKDRKCWLMYYDDPMTGKRITRSTKETAEGAARKAAGAWEADLKKGRYKPKSYVTWAEFRTAYLEAWGNQFTANGFAATVTSLNAVERHIKIDRLAELTSNRIAFLVKQLRDVDQLSDESIRSYLSHIRAALNWAKKENILHEVPAVEMPKRSKGKKVMKGRAITSEEFERMMGKVEAGLILASTSRINANRKRQPSETATANRMQRLTEGAAKAAPSWLRFIRGLWWSGLRLTEASTLSWDDERYITVDMSGPRPRLRIGEGQDKSQEARLLPLAPEFAEMLLAVPEEARTGRVFPLLGIQGEPVTDEIYVSRVVGKIGEAAGVKVDEKMRGSRKLVKFASAHDLRRAFAVRWAARVMPAVLQEFMRHVDIDTTMKYYAGQAVEAMEDAAYVAFARVNKIVNSQPVEVANT